MEHGGSGVEVQTAVRCLRAQVGTPVEVTLSAPAEGGLHIVARIDGRLRAVFELGESEAGPLVAQLDAAAVLIRRSQLSGVWLQSTTDEGGAEPTEISFELGPAARVEISWGSPTR